MSVPADAATRAAGHSGRAASFASELAAAVERRQSQVVLGLDPDPARLWPGAMEAAGDAGTPAERAADAVAAHCAALVGAAGPACVAVKPQLACFERLGAPGWHALARTIDAAHAAGLLVLADGKRGDIDVTAAAYAQALLGEVPTPFGPVAGLGADATTVNPYMGEDALAPFVGGGRGVFVLVRTSNPGAAELQDAVLADGRPLWERAAALVDRLGQGTGEPEGLADVGAVIGATAPEKLARARELMPRAPLLLPGVGAQGGRVEDLAPGFAAGRSGALITASRSLARAHEATGGDPAGAARAEAERLRAAAWALA